MAIGDRTPIELFQLQLSSTATTQYTNNTTYRTQLLQLWICNTGANQRTITLYKNGISEVNQLSNAIVLSANTSIVIDTKIVFTSTQTFSAKQDAGSDVSITGYGITEQIA